MKTQGEGCLWLAGPTPRGHKRDAVSASFCQFHCKTM